MAARCYPFSGDTSLTCVETVALTLASIVGQLDESKPGGFRRFQMLAQRVIDSALRLLVSRQEDVVISRNA